MNLATTNHLKKIGIIISFLLLMPAGISLAQTWVEPQEGIETMNFYEVQDRFDEYWSDKDPSKGRGWKQFKRLEYFWEDRVWPHGEIPDATEVMRHWKRWLASYKPQNQMMNNKQWEFIGPSIRPEKRQHVPDPGMGRMNCVAFHPTNPNIIWAGAAFGGVWLSTDGGQNWKTFPFTSFLSIGISDIAIARSNPSTIYAATGDADSFGVLGVNFNFSIGIIKTTDNGQTWSTTAFNPEVHHGVIVNSILVHPEDEDIIFVGSNAGFYFSTNGGAGWGRIAEGNFRELEFKPDDPDVIYAASISGQTYSLRKFIVSSGTMNTTATLEGISRVEMATTRADNNVVYALCSNWQALGAFAAVLKSTDAGESWAVVADGSEHPNYLDFSHDGSGPNGQGLYDLAIAVHPTNENTVYIGGVNIWKSTNGGISWNLTGEWTGNFGPFIHADHHELKYSPNGHLYSANDGGIRYTRDGGASWLDISDGLEVTQFYRIDTYKKDKNLMYGGTQDNGTHRFEHGEWKNVRGGDGMECLVDYTNKDYVYVSIYNGDFVRSTDGGETFRKMINPEDKGEDGAWVTPMAMHPSDPKTLFVGYYNLWKSTDRGASWEQLTNVNTQGATMRTIRIAESNPDVIYISYTGAVLKTNDGGQSWAIIHQTQDAPVKDICVDPNNPDRAWITFSGYDVDKKVFELNGQNVIDKSGNLPKVPVNTIVYQKESPDRLYVGTDVGVFYRDNNMQDWDIFGENLPNVVVNELEIHEASGLMRAATYGRGLWEVELVDCNLPPPELSVTHGDPEALCEGDSLLIKVKSSYREYLWSNGKSGRELWVKKSGEYYVTVTDEKGCTAQSDIITVRVENVPDLEVDVKGDNPFCEGESTRLAAKGFGFKEYEWSNGMDGKRIEVSQPGTYYVTGTTVNGCERRTESVEITMNPSPEKPEITRNGDTLTSSAADSYQWYMDDEAIEGANSREYVADESGMYSVEAINSFGCSTMSDQLEVITSVEGATAGSYIVLQPNPASSAVMVEAFTPEYCDVHIGVRNILGSKLISINDTKLSDVYTREIDLRELPKGAYFVTVRCGEYVETMKLMVE